MKEFFKKRRELIVIFVYACLITVIVYFVVLPIIKEITIRRDQLQEEKANQEGSKKKIAGLPKLKEQFLAIESEGNKLDVLLKQEDAVVLIEKIEQLGQNTQNVVKISVVENDPTSREAIIAEKNKAKNSDVTIASTLPSKNYLEMKITIDGGYNNIVNFIKKVESMQYYSDMLSFQLKRYDDSRDVQANAADLPSPFSPEAKSQPINVEHKLTAIMDVAFYLKK